MSISVWDDIESPEDYNHKRKLTQSLVATASLEPYFLASVSSDDFDNRVGMAEDRIQAVASEHGIDSGEIVEHFRRKASLVIEANAAQRRTASRKQAVDMDRVMQEIRWRDPSGMENGGVPANISDADFMKYHQKALRDHESWARRSFGDQAWEDYNRANHYEGSRRRVGSGSGAQDHEIESWVNPSAWDDKAAAHRVIEEIKSDHRNGSEQDWINVARRHEGSRKQPSVMQRVALVRQALEEGVDPLEWLVEETEARANNVGAEKPSEAGIEAVVGAPKGHQPSGS